MGYGRVAGSEALGFTYLWSAVNEGMEKNMETTMMGCIGSTPKP